MRKNKIRAAALLAAAALALSSCARPGTDDENHVHKVLHWEVAHEADCENGGRRFGICVECMNEVREENEPLGHSYRGGTCLRCGENKEESTEASDVRFEYELAMNGSGYILVSASVGEQKHIEIPALHEGLPVVQIGGEVFLNCAGIESVTVPDGVREIGQNAFSGCTRLRNVQMSDTLEKLGERAFYGCEKLTEALLPETLVTIGNHCFFGCISLERVEARGLTAVGNSAFEGCERLYSFDFPDCLTSIGDRTFYESSVREAKLPQGLEKLGQNAFSGTPIRSAFVPKGLSRDFYSGFDRCDMLEHAVVETDNLRGDFAECPSLKTIVFSEGVTYIDTNAVDTCESLETVVLPKSLSFMGETFLGSNSLRRIVYAGTLEEWLALKRNFYWSFMNEECVLECSDVTLTREELREHESLGA